jgi:Outer membrane protein beta-barrel domain
MRKQFLHEAMCAMLLLIFAGTARAQTNDLGATAGGYFAGSNPLNIGAAGALEASYAHRIASVPLLSLSAELPLAASFRSAIPTLSGITLARSYTSLFIAPGVRLRLAPRFPLSPYVSVGLGYGRFQRRLFNNTTSSYGALAVDIGGGLDIKILPYVSLRGEVRDFNSSTAGIESLLAAGRQNNFFVTFGLGVRF